jgi:hypothetical protein
MGDTRAQAIRISAPILIDSRYRRGTDIAKALALGANAVLLGRTSLYGLAAAGEAGVDHVLHLLKDEVERRLAQIGCPSVSELSPDWGRKGVRNLFSRIPDLLISLVILLAVELPSAADRACAERASKPR